MAISFRFSADMPAARALPPIRPSATAAAFLPSSVVISSISPVAVWPVASCPSCSHFVPGTAAIEGIGGESASPRIALFDPERHLAKADHALPGRVRFRSYRAAEHGEGAVDASRLRVDEWIDSASTSAHLRSGRGTKATCWPSFPRTGAPDVRTVRNGH